MKRGIPATAVIPAVMPYFDSMDKAYESLVMVYAYTIGLRDETAFSAYQEELRDVGALLQALSPSNVKRYLSSAKES